MTSPLVYAFFFFFKQKTAYEIVSGDWSSDVCSSDLHEGEEKAARRRRARRARRRAAPAAEARALRAAAAETERHPGEGRGRARRGAEEEGAAVSWKVLIVAEHDGAKLDR